MSSGSDRPLSGMGGHKEIGTSQPASFLWKPGVHTDRGDSGCASTDRNLLKLRGIASDMENSLLWLWFLPLPHAGARQAITALACWDCQKLDEQEAVNRRTGASVQLANSLPGSLAPRVPYCLPVQQLIPETVIRGEKLMCCSSTAGLPLVLKSGFNHPVNPV